MGRGSPGVAQMRGLVWGSLLTSSWGSTTGTHLKIRRDVSPTVTQRFSLWESGGTRSERPELSLPRRLGTSGETYRGVGGAQGRGSFANGASLEGAREPADPRASREVPPVTEKGAMAHRPRGRHGHQATGLAWGRARFGAECQSLRGRGIHGGSCSGRARLGRTLCRPRGVARRGRGAVNPGRRWRTHLTPGPPLAKGG